MALQASILPRGGGASRREKPKGRYPGVSHNHGLSKEKYQEIYEAFQLFDTDGSGMNSLF